VCGHISQPRATYTMPPQCQVLQEISGNHRKQPHLTPAHRLQIISKLQAGCLVAELVAEFQRDPSTIRQTIHNIAKHSTTLKAARTGRPPTLSLHQKKITYRKACAAPNIEYSKLAEAAVFVDAEGTPSKPPSHSTLYRCLKERGLANYRCKSDQNSTVGML
jgi:transposase